MLYESKRVNLNNYQDIFKGMSKDVLEVIRSAILDDTPIQEYIKPCKNDPIRLWQLKLAIDEGLDEDVLNKVKSGSVLYEIRQLHSKRMNIAPLKQYLSSDLPERYLKYILKWYSQGISLERYNFGILPENLLPVFDKGISLGLPMHIFNTGKGFTSGYVSSCLIILSNGKTVSPLLTGDWYDESLKLLADYSKYKRFKDLLGYLKSDITPGMLSSLIEASKAGMSLEDLASVDDEGEYIFTPIQISLFTEAFKKGLTVSKLLDPNNSPDTLRMLIAEEEYNGSKQLKGLL